MIAVLAGALSFVWAQAFYRLAIVPRLPEWQSVPIGWWVIEFSPAAASVVALGILSSTTRQAAINGVLLVVPAVTVANGHAALTNTPVGHDVMVSDAINWLGVAVQVCAVVFGVIITATISRGLTTRRHGV